MTIHMRWTLTQCTYCCTARDTANAADCVHPTPFFLRATQRRRKSWERKGGNSIERNNRKVRAVGPDGWSRKIRTEKNRFMCLKELMVETKVAFNMWLPGCCCKFYHWRLQNTIISHQHQRQAFSLSVIPMRGGIALLPFVCSWTGWEAMGAFFASNHIPVVRAACIFIRLLASSSLLPFRIYANAVECRRLFRLRTFYLFTIFVIVVFTFLLPRNRTLWLLFAEIIIVMLMPYASTRVRSGDWGRCVCVVRSDAS